MKNTIIILMLVLLTGCGVTQKETSDNKGNMPALRYTDDGVKMAFVTNNAICIESITYTVITSELLVIQVKSPEAVAITVNVIDSSRSINISWQTSFSGAVTGQLEWYFGMTNSETQIRKQTEHTSNEADEFGHSDFLKKGYTKIEVIANNILVDEFQM